MAEESQGSLTEQEEAILKLEKKRFKHSGSKEAYIGRTLGLSPARLRARRDLAEGQG